MLLFARGIALLGEKTYGRWWVEPGATSAKVELCARTYVLNFADATAPWEFSALDVSSGEKRANGKLTSHAQRVTTVLPESPEVRVDDALGAAAADFAGQIAGSGPWRWSGFPPIGFMRGGELHTPWGGGRWGVERRGKKAAEGVVFADFGGGEHDLRALDLDCLKLTSTRVKDGERVGIDFTPAALGASTRAKDDSCAAQVEKLVR